MFDNLLLTVNEILEFRQCQLPENSVPLGYLDIQMHPKVLLLNEIDFLYITAALCHMHVVKWYNYHIKCNEYVKINHIFKH